MLCLVLWLLAGIFVLALGCWAFDPWMFSIGFLTSFLTSCLISLRWRSR